MSINKEAMLDRAHDLADKGFNGMKLVLVSLPSPPVEAVLEVHFYNNNGITSLQNEFAGDAALAGETFRIIGGQRITGGPGEEQVKVTGVKSGSGDTIIELKVYPVGDYSEYTLQMQTSSVSFKNIDPLFSEIDFKFRPGCFSLDCSEPDVCREPARENPGIDYCAKDYESFRYALISAMMDRVPEWKATSEADLDMVLLELFSTAADELSDFQDRVMNEAYLSSCRKRVSLARHARLMDYHIHQGGQASTILALELQGGAAFEEPALFSPGFAVWSGCKDVTPASPLFLTKSDYTLHYLLNRMSLYTWNGAKPGLDPGSTRADLILQDNTENNVKKVRDLIRQGKITRLVIQEQLNPETGRTPGKDPLKRQVLHLLPGEAGAGADVDPVTGEWYVRVSWEKQDALRSCFLFDVQAPGGIIHDVSLFHGNLVDVFHGEPREILFKPPGEMLDVNEYSCEYTPRGEILCPLPTDAPLAYTHTPPGNELPSRSTLQVWVAGDPHIWQEAVDFIHSRESDTHYVVETDELGRSLIRFGNGVNGKSPDRDAVIYCVYQAGRGRDGNLGADKLTFFDSGTSPWITRCWNPFPVTNGSDPEPVQEIIRRVQEAYVQRQLRAVTEEDYVKRAEELPEVSRAAARYMWTGSFRTVRISIDPVGSTELTPAVRKKIARHLDAVRLLGEDLEIRPPRFVPLAIEVSLCISPGYWPEDISYVITDEFSDSYTRDGRKGFFHPDEWTFGRPLYKSMILGRIRMAKGIDHVRNIIIKRFNEDTPGPPDDEMVMVRENEIILVRNDSDHMERGFIRFHIMGGRG
jgi:hypothetical protein